MKTLGQFKFELLNNYNNEDIVELAVIKKFGSGTERISLSKVNVEDFLYYISISTLKDHDLVIMDKVLKQNRSRLPKLNPIGMSIAKPNTGVRKQPRYSSVVCNAKPRMYLGSQTNLTIITSKYIKQLRATAFNQSATTRD